MREQEIERGKECIIEKGRERMNEGEQQGEKRERKIVICYTYMYL